jgi:hypothetical protein
MRPHNAMNDEEVKEGAREGMRGAAIGGLKYGVAMLILGGIGQAMSPLYRGLTIQFKL